MEEQQLKELKAALYWISVSHQQNFYELSPDWNKYKTTDYQDLKNYIGCALYGAPSNQDDDNAYIFEEKNASKNIGMIFEKIMDHGVQISDKSIHCTIIYTCIYNEKELLPLDTYPLEDNIYTKPLFKVKKNIKINEQDITFSNYFIDIDFRVYTSWEDYLENNTMPSCTMINPKNGDYQANLKELWFENQTPVWVEKYVQSSNNVLKVVDITSTVVGLVSAGVGIAAAFTPVIGPVAIGASFAAGTVSGIWGGARGVQELIDKKLHDESLIGREAIPAWLGVVGTATGVASVGGSALLSRAIRTGTSVSRGAQIAHDAVMIGNLAVNGAGILHNSYSMYRNYRDGEGISGTDALFLATNIFFVCNSAMNLKLAKSIIKTDQQAFLQEHENSLRSNRHRKEYRRLVKNTAKNISDEVKRNEEIIRSINKINNKDEFYATLARNRKLISSSGTNLSFADGHIQISSTLFVSPAEFTAMSKEAIKNLLNQTSSQASCSNKSQMLLQKHGNISLAVLSTGTKELHQVCLRNSYQLGSNSGSNWNKFNNIVGDIQNLPQYPTIIKILTEAALSIVFAITKGEVKVTELCKNAANKLLDEVLGFLWDVVKEISVKVLPPGASSLIVKHEDTIIKTSKCIFKEVISNLGEWIKNFFQYIKIKQPESNWEIPEDKTKNSKKADKFFFEGIELLDPSEVMSLTPEELQSMVFSMINSIESSFIKSDRILEDLEKLCKKEMEEFFDIHPIPLNFKTENIASELKGILNDIRFFDKKDIILYKLIVCSCNLSHKISNCLTLESALFVDVIKCMWLFVLLNFHKHAPDLKLCSPEAENNIIQIIMAIYRYFDDDPDKWVHAFYEYQCNYNMI